MPMSGRLRLVDPGSRVIAGYAPASHKLHPAPYVIITSRPASETLPDAIGEKQLRASVAAYFGWPEEKLKEGPGPSQPQMLLNESKGGFYFTTPPGYAADMDVPGLGNLHIHAVAFLTRKGPVNFQFMGSTADLAAAEPAVNGIVSSIAFEPGVRMKTSGDYSIVMAGAILLAFLAGGYVFIQAFRKTFLRRR